MWSAKHVWFAQLLGGEEFEGGFFGEGPNWGGGEGGLVPLLRNAGKIWSEVPCCCFLPHPRCNLPTNVVTVPPHRGGGGDSHEVMVPPLGGGGVHHKTVP